MTFQGKEIKDPNIILKPKEYSINNFKPIIKNQNPKNENLLEIEELKKLKELQELENQNLELIKEQEELIIPEQINKTKLKENKKSKELKKIQKPKKIDLNKFLTRIVGYEQKKNLNLEQKRFKKLEEENKICKDTPLLSPRTYEICKTLNKRPITEIAEDLTEKKEKKKYNFIDKDNNKLRNKKNFNKRLNNSMENINRDNNENKIKKEDYNNKIKNKKMNESEINDYYKRQFEWKNKLEEKNRIKEKNKKNLKLKEIDYFFQPKISPTSLEIIKEKKMKTRYKNNNYYTKNEIYKNYLNYEMDVYDRLYEEKDLLEIKKNKYENKALSSFHPFINKNKYKQIQPKYMENKNNKIKKRSKIKKDKLKGAKSVEADRKKYNTIIENEKKSNIFIKIKENINNNDDNSYKINIRQATAWNENDVNIVPYNINTKEIVKNFI